METGNCFKNEQSAAMVNPMGKPTCNSIANHFPEPARGNRTRIESPGHSGERGTEILEFAFVISLLMMLLLGIVTFARAYNIYQTITRAAREGARMAVLPSCASCGNSYLDPSTGVTEANSAVFADYIAPALQAANLNPDAVLNYSESVGWLDAGDTQEQCGVKIAFQYPYQLNLPFTSQNFATIHIPVQVQMRRENQPTGGSCP